MPQKLVIPHEAIAELRNNLLGGNVTRRDSLELSVSAQNENLNVRDFTAFLRMADRIYAVFYPDGPRAYSRRFDPQLKIHSIHASMVDIKFLVELENIVRSNPLITIWILGTVLRRGSESFKNFTEGLLNVKHLFEAASPQDPKPADVSGADTNVPAQSADREISGYSLAGISDDALIQIASFLDEALKNEYLTQAGRFAREEIVELELRIKKR